MVVDVIYHVLMMSINGKTVADGAVERGGHLSRILPAE